MIEIKIGDNEENQRLDKFLKKYLPNAPLSYIYKTIRKKNIKLNGKKADINQMLKKGDVLNLYIKDEELTHLTKKKSIKKAKKQFKVAYEDKNILVVEKPKGLLVHGSKEEKKNTLVNQVCSYLYQNDQYDPSKEKTFVPAAVNRLDRNTSGLVIFGKHYKSLQILNSMIREKNYIRKYYLTIVSGHMAQSMHLKDHIIKDEDKNKVSLVNKTDSNTKFIETTFKPLAHNGTYTLVEAELITGRTHQIRVHLANAGYPIIGDEKYGKRKLNEKFKKEFGLKNQYLHAHKLFFEKGIDLLAYLEKKEICSELSGQLKEIKEKIFDKK